jgi:hypothetical protein
MLSFRKKTFPLASIDITPGQMLLWQVFSRELKMNDGELSAQSKTFKISQW